MASTHRDEISRLELLHAAHPDGLVFPHLADAYRRAGRYAQAESVLNAGLRHHSDYSSAHIVLGRLRLDQGKFEEAERAFQRVLELDPQNHVALDYLGRLSIEQGRLEQALDQFRRLARVKPGEEVDDRIRELERRVSELRGEDGAVGDGFGGNGGGRRPAGELDAPRTEVADLEGDRERPSRVPPPHQAREPEGDPPLMRLPEPGEVVTETMAELYARQGLSERAVAVYRQLLQRDPGNARLAAKLRAARADMDGRAPPAATPAAAAPAPAAPAPPRPGGGASRAEARPTSTSIRSHLGSLLAWNPGDRSPSGARRDPWADGPWAETPRVEAPRVETPAAAPPAPRTEDTWPEEPWAEGPAVEDWAPEDRLTTAPAPKARVREVSRTDEPSSGIAGSTSTAGLLIAITDMLVGLLEYRDPFFRGSSSLTRLVAEQVGEELELGRQEREDLALAAVLRDLGRLAMGSRLVSLSGAPTSEARRRIERHVDLALHMMEGIELPQAVRLAVRHHHERWDGAGYPDGLAGEDIPLLARVLAVVDSFGAMVSPRSYRLPRKVPDAVRELREAAGTQYDPAVVEALIRVLARQDQPTAGVLQRPHILLVNADQPGAVVTAAKLCTAGYLAEVSGDASAARERLRRVPVAAMVVSAETGEDETAEFVRELRVDPRFSTLPIVVVEAASVALRVRLLESGADVCFPPGTSHAELQGTLAALVRRALRIGRMAAEDGPGKAQEAPWLALQGDVEDFPLTWLLQVMKYDSRTAAIGIRTATSEGAIYLQNGDAVHAQIRDGAKGETALRAMLEWEKGRFTVQPDARPNQRTIQSSIMHLLLTQAVDQDHAAAGIFGAVSDEG